MVYYTWVLFLYVWLSFFIGSKSNALTELTAEIWECNKIRKREVRQGKKQDHHTSFKQTPELTQLCTVFLCNGALLRAFLFHSLSVLSKKKNGLGQCFTTFLTP